MTESAGKLRIISACIVVFLLLLQLGGTALAKTDAKQTADMRGAVQSEEIDLSDANWLDGRITQPTQFDPKAKRVRIVINDVQYVLGADAVILVKAEDESGKRFESVANVGVLRPGSKVSFVAAGASHKIITQIVVEAIPLKN